MKVTTGAERSGISNTVSPFDWSTYSEMVPTVLTNLKPGTSTTGAGAAPAALKREAYSTMAAITLCIMG